MIRQCGAPHAERESSAPEAMNGYNPTRTVKRPSSPRAATEYSWKGRHLPSKLRPPPARRRTVPHRRPARLEVPPGDSPARRRPDMTPEDENEESAAETRTGSLHRRPTRSSLSSVKLFSRMSRSPESGRAPRGRPHAPSKMAAWSPDSFRGETDRIRNRTPRPSKKMPPGRLRRWSARKFFIV